MKNNSNRLKKIDQLLTANKGKEKRHWYDGIAEKMEELSRENRRRRKAGLPIENSNVISGETLSSIIESLKKTEQ